MSKNSTINYDGIKRMLNTIRTIKESTNNNGNVLMEQVAPAGTENQQSDEIIINDIRVVIDTTDQLNKKISDEERSEISGFIDSIYEGFTDLPTFSDIMIYEDGAKWAGRIESIGLDFLFETGNERGVFLTTQMAELDDEFLNVISKLNSFKDSFITVFNNIIIGRREN